MLEEPTHMSLAFAALFGLCLAEFLNMKKYVQNNNIRKWKQINWILVLMSFGCCICALGVICMQISGHVINNIWVALQIGSLGSLGINKFLSKNVRIEDE